MVLLLILAIGFYLYKTGELQKVLNKFQFRQSPDTNGARRVLDLRYASGQISTEEYIKLKNIL
ncbi:hypothetical protein ACTQ5K_15795 [Niallia sp. Sow4_A1]|uniref:SHOCT domain-containing protein n=1 Tax=Niallia hominis TaxID=3133173 RepID=A0ABV1F596_9BACI|nr:MULTISPECIES: hypothetical protein [Bacillaceae]MCM3365031.1 hypothetical protein [Niallia sp. MER TA 168]